MVKDIMEKAKSETDVTQGSKTACKGKTGKITSETEKKKVKFRKLFTLLVIILLGLTFVSKSLYNYRLPVVTVMRPMEGRIVYTIEGTSKFTYAHRESAYAEVDGRIREILAEQGDRVTQGQCLMRIESPGTGEIQEVTAATDGIIMQIGVEKGMYVSSTQNTVLYETARESGEWACSLIVSDEQAEHVGRNNRLTMNVPGLKERVEGEIRSVVPCASQSQEGYTVEIAVNSELPLAGERVKIVMEEESELYDTIIPVTALHRDSQGYYALVLREDDSVLGQGYRAHRMSVELLDSDEAYCAVRGIPSDEYVIVTTTGEIGDGSSVYYEDGKLW